MAPIPFPKEAIRVPAVAEQPESVRPAEATPVTRKRPMASDYLSVLRSIMERTKINGSQIYPHERLQAEHCIDALAEVLEGWHERADAEDRQHARRHAEGGCAHD